MGNYFWSKPNNETLQPESFKEFPKPYPLEKINPELLIYSIGCRYDLCIDHTVEPSVAVEMMKKSLTGRRRLVVLTHGFLSHRDTPWLMQIKDALFDVDSNQVVCVLGWGGGSNIGLFRYPTAAANALEVGTWLARYLTAIRLQFPQIEIYAIGHSLGAHTMGMAGKKCQVIDRITGLDPAGVGFQVDSIDKRLSPSDAKLVDVIHTDGLDVPYFGTLIPLGHIDFYPNFGWNQPSKEGNKVKPTIFADSSMQKIATPSPMGSNMSESHGRAIEFFLWSINNRGAFRSIHQLAGKPDVEKAVHRIRTCKLDLDECIEVEMGYFCDQHLNFMQNQRSLERTALHGCYFVQTNASQPWC